MHVMTTEIITRDDNSSVKEATEIINLNKISCLIAARKGKAVGIITERDLLKRVILEAKKRQKVSEVMSKPSEVISPDTNLKFALRVIFEKKT